jgi:hypothetical protein
MKVLAISNNLQVSKSLQTKVIKFKHSQDAFGFQYSEMTSFFQQFRIECVFGRIAKYPLIEKIYRDQSGNFRNQSVSIDRQQTLKTGYLDDNSHNALSASLKHSDVYLDEVKYFNQGEYTIDGDDDENLTNLTIAHTALNKQGYNRTSVSC